MSGLPGPAVPADAPWRLRCPHCGLAALPAWRKLLLGPAGRTPCRHCVLAVGVAPGPAVLAWLPCLLVVAVALSGGGRRPLLLVAATVLAVATTSVLHLVSVPLVRRQLTDAAAVRRALEKPAPPASPS